jgi:hypothetical protein
LLPVVRLQLLWQLQMQRRHRQPQCRLQLASLVSLPLQQQLLSLRMGIRLGQRHLLKQQRMLASLPYPQSITAHPLVLLPLRMLSPLGRPLQPLQPPLASRQET